jgi:hypothetical protein
MQVLTDFASQTRRHIEIDIDQNVQFLGRRVSQRLKSAPVYKQAQ